MTSDLGFLCKKSLLFSIHRPINKVMRMNLLRQLFRIGKKIVVKYVYNKQKGHKRLYAALTTILMTTVLKKSKSP